MFDQGEVTGTRRRPAAGPLPDPTDEGDAAPPAAGLEDHVEDAAVFGGMPGPELAAELAAADPATLGGYALVEAVGGWERLVSWAQARQLAAIAELAYRRPSGGDPGGPQTRTSGVSEFCPDEVAVALRLSRQGACLRLGLALELCDRLPATSDALARGEISLPRARVIADGVRGLPDQLARAVEQRVLPRASKQTPGQLRAAVARAVIAVDPAAAEKRHRKEKAERRVEKHPLPETGMGELWAYLTAVELRTAWAAVDAAARAAATPGDGRTMDERRADALVDLLAGRSPAATGATATDTGKSAATSATGPGDTGKGAAGAGVLAARAQVTVAATTLLGWDEQPGELAGYGPVPASVARQIAADATWRGILTDPATGAIAGLSRRTYTPGVMIGAYVRARDRTCRFPGCRQPAARCDIDHTMAWPRGATAPCNLACLCRHHHRLKQHPDWHLRQDAHGRLTWTTPAGHTHITEPPAADPSAHP